MRRFLEFALSFMLSLVVWMWVATPMHEGFHYLVAKSLGVKGIISLTWSASGFFTYIDTPTQFQDVVIGLAGGLGSAIVLGLLWVLAQYQTRYTTWEMDDAASLLIVVVAQAVYAPFDAWWPAAAFYGIGVGFLVGIIVAGLMYGKRVLDFLSGHILTS